MQYGHSRTVNLSYDDALERVQEELKERGFGVLTEVDVKATMKEKLDEDMNNYKILGACNPPFAHQALQMELLQRKITAQEYAAAFRELIALGLENGFVQGDCIEDDRCNWQSW